MLFTPEENDQYFDCEDTTFGNDLGETLLDGVNLNGSSWVSMSYEDFLKEENLNRPVNVAVDTTIGQLFYLILAFCAASSLSCAARTNLFLLINNIFGLQVLPSSKFLLDKLLNPCNDAQFHAVCNFCGSYIGQFGEALKLIKHCSFCKNKLNLQSSASTNFFVLFNPSQQISDLISMFQDYYKKIMNGETGSTPNTISDVYDGKAYKKFVANLPQQNKKNYLSATLNTDGAQKFESSKYSMWPILLMLNELPAQARLTNIITCGIWYSKIQPEMNIFLGQFVQYFNNLQKKGINCVIDGQNRSIPLYILQCCVDSAARAKVQGVKLHSGYHSCNWCLQKGYYENGAVRFPYEKILKLRQEDETREKMQFFVDKATDEERKMITETTGIKGICSLFKLTTFNIISGFVPDYMHCILEGVAKLLTDLHVKNMTELQIQELDRIMMNIAAPHQVSRLTRGISKRGQWKAKEWENYVLFYSYPLLSTFLPREQLKHWLLFSNSLYTLLQRKISIDVLKEVRKALKEFVKDFKTYYGIENMTFNVHLLLHIADSVLTWGPIWTQSTFPFESENHTILKAIKSANGVTHQIVRFVNYCHRTSILGMHVMPHMTQLLKRYCEELFSGKRVKCVKKVGDHTYFETCNTARSVIERDFETWDNAIYTKMVKDGCLYSTSSRATRSNNSYAYLIDGTFIRIVAFLVDPNNLEERIICRYVKVCDLSINKSGPMKQVLETSDQTVLVFTHQLQSICVFAESGTSKFICPLPNLLHY